MSIFWNTSPATADLEWTSMAQQEGHITAIAKTGSGYRAMGLNFNGEAGALKPTPADNEWTSVAFGQIGGNSIYVAVAQTGTGNRVMTADYFGNNWTIGTTPADNEWTSVVVGTIYVAVAKSGTGNRVMTSPDGYNWTLRNSAADNEWTSVTYGGPAGYVAVAKSGTGNRVMTSPDGINWTLRNTPADNDWTAVKWCVQQGLYVAVASGGPANRIMTSPNGINWTLGTSPEANLCEWRAIETASPGPGYIYIFGGGTGTSRAMISSDGFNWTPLNTGNTDANYTCALYSPGFGVIVALAGSGTGNRVARSDVYFDNTQPAAPTITSVTAYNQQAEISFTQGSPSENIINYAYAYSVDGGATFKTFTYINPETTSSPLTITGLQNNAVVSFRIRASNGAIFSTNSNTIYNQYVYTSQPIFCFKDDTKILTNNGYVIIRDLKEGDLVETFSHGLKPITVIGRTEIIHEATEERIYDQLYKYCKTEDNELTEDLVLTGRHAVLVDEFPTTEEKDNTYKMYGIIKKTDGKYHLPAAVNDKFVVHDIPGQYTVYHLALQNDNENMNYGIYANGLLVESCSEKYLKSQTSMLQ